MHRILVLLLVLLFPGLCLADSAAIFPNRPKPVRDFVSHVRDAHRQRVEARRSKRAAVVPQAPAVSPPRTVMPPPPKGAVFLSNPIWSRSACPNCRPE